MKRILLGLICVFSLGLTSNVFTNNDIMIKDKIAYNKSTNKLLDGILVSYPRTKDGNLEMRQVIKNGKLNGITKAYYDDGNLYTEIEYKDNLVVNTEKLYYRDGKLMITREYKNGKPFGPMKKYYESGNIKIESHNYGNVASSKHFYENGKVQAEYSMKNGKYDGSFTEYNNKGNLIKEILYMNAKVVVIKVYNAEGNLEFEGTEKEYEKYEAKKYKEFFNSFK